MDNLKNKITAYLLSDVGNVRKNNEDNFIIGHCLNEFSERHQASVLSQENDSWTLFGVFDGMGGCEGGEVASYIAAKELQTLSFGISKKTAYEIDDLMEEAFNRINLKIVDERKNKYAGGTTASVLVTNGSQYKVFHRGDSRIYLIRNGQIFMQTKDHTLAQLKMDIGIEANEKDHHMLTEFLGMDDSESQITSYKTEWKELNTGDQIIICSDGLYDMCSEKIILSEIMKNDDCENCVNNLTQLALNNGGRDNVTIMMLKVE